MTSLNQIFRVLLTLALALAALPAPEAGATQAMRTAVMAAKLIRSNGTMRTRHSALDVAFDAKRPEASPVPTEGRIIEGRPNRLGRGAHLTLDSAPDGMPGPAIPFAGPSALDRLETAVKGALQPWRRLLDTAVGGAWTGAVALASVTP